MQSTLISDHQVALKLGCGRATVWRYVSKGLLPKPIKIGSMTRWLVSEIDAFIARAAERIS